MFKALVDGEEVNLDHRIPDALPAGERLALHGAKPDIRCRGCNGRATTRMLNPNARLPFMVFAHNAGYGAVCRALGYHTDESEGHYDLKSRLAEAARSAGWKADTEVYGDHCRADVVATSPTGKTKWVWEAQLASIKAPDVVERTGRYADQFGKVTWVHTRRRNWSNRHEDVECLRVDEDDLGLVVGGVYLDRTGQEPAPPAPVERTVAEVLGQKITYVFAADFGYYFDIAAAADRAAGRKPRARRVPPVRQEQGSHVRECDRARRLPCVWCGKETARIAPDGNPRHGWCEVAPDRMWHGMRRPDRAIPSGRS